MIKKLRIDRGLKAVELARRASIDPRTLSAIETGRNTAPSSTTLRKIADALGVDIRDLWAAPTDTAGE